MNIYFLFVNKKKEMKKAWVTSDGELLVHEEGYIPLWQPLYRYLSGQSRYHAIEALRMYGGSGHDVRKLDPNLRNCYEDWEEWQKLLQIKMRTWADVVSGTSAR